jgi:hypothetical protein
MDDPVRDLELPKVKAELLASRMKQWKYLDEGMKISFYRNRQKILEGGHSSGMQRCGWLVQSNKHEPPLR